MEQARWACTIDIESRYSLKEDYAECLVGFQRYFFFELLPRNQTINSNVYCRQLMKLDKEMKEKRPELATRKGVIFYQYNTRAHTSWSLAKNYWSQTGKWCLIYRIVLTLHHPIIIYSVYFKTIWMEKHSIQMRLSKMSWFSFFASNNQTFYESGIMKPTERL